MKTEAWVAALRSGKYEQGQNALCDGSHFCCLGVLAEIAGVPQLSAPERIREGYDCNDDPIYKFEIAPGQFNFSSTSIPPPLWSTFLEDLDLGTVVPETELHARNTLARRLMAMNDEGSTFSDIADYIEDVKNGHQ